VSLLWAFTPNPSAQNKDDIHFFHYVNTIPLPRNEKKKQTSYNTAYEVAVFSENLHPNALRFSYAETLGEML